MPASRGRVSPFSDLNEVARVGLVTRTGVGLSRQEPGAPLAGPLPMVIRPTVGYPRRPRVSGLASRRFDGTNVMPQVPRGAVGKGNAVIRSSIARSFRILSVSGFLTLAIAGPGLAQLGFVQQNALITDGETGFPAGLLTTGDRFGAAVGDASDLDLDGHRDLVVGAPGVDTSFTDAGEVFLVQLLSEGAIDTVTLLDFNSETLLAAGDGFGSSVARLADMSVDGIDFAVGAPGDDTGHSNAGAVWVVRVGPDLSGANPVKIANGQSGFQFPLNPSDGFGTAVAAMGDLDANDIPDLVVTAPGRDFGATATDRGAAYFLFLDGQNEVNSAVELPFHELGGTADSDFIGASIATIGDLNGDGFKDIAVGAPLDDTGGTDTGAVYLLFLDGAGGLLGERKIASGDPDLSSFGVVLSAGDRFGSSLSASDLNGDGQVELFVGADQTDGKGAVWLLSLTSTGFVNRGRKLGAGAGEATFNTPADQRFGAGVAAMGDVDSNGIRDVAIGHPQNSAISPGAGAVWVAMLGTCGDGVVDADEECDDGDPSGNDCCAANCVLREDFASCDDSNPCSLVDVCISGVCQKEPDGASAEGTPCDDGDACTVQDECPAVGTTCTGVPKDCSGFGSACSIGFCSEGGDCETLLLPNSTPCEDGNGCTSGEFCTSGVCGSGLDVADGSFCNDGQNCTTMDSCLAGSCFGAPLDCSFLDSECTQGFCEDMTGTCSSLTIEDGAECDDGDPCTIDDQCSAGFCEGVPKDCSAFDDACNEGACDAMTGACEPLPTGDGSPCDDGKICTENDLCDAGACVGAGKDCSAAGDQCNDGVCNAGTGACQPAPKPDGISCSDGDACTEFDQCSGGFCQASPKDCSSFADACNVGRCDALSGNCFADPNMENPGCDDGNPCTEFDQCAAGVCGGTAKDCSSAGDQCNDGVCNAGTGACGPTPKPDGISCSDGNLCTEFDQCSGGACSATPKDCSSFADACNLAACDAMSGSCVTTPNPSNPPCDDGNPCTVNDECAAGVCAGSAKDCSAAGDQCNDGTCNAGSGACEPTPKSDGTVCSDGDVCTESDQCSGGACAATPKDCSAFNDACNLGACDAMTGFCVATPNLSNPPCDDGNPCTENDQCAAGVCDGAAKDCSAAGDQCNDGVCDSGTGACEPTPKADGVSCSDGDVCTEFDQCSSGACAATPKDCSSLNDACNLGACDAMSGSCVATPNLSNPPCDDGNPCTVNDQCAAGVCAGSAKDCSAAGDQCNDGTCNAGSGACEPTPKSDGTVCSDGDVCTEGDQCAGGICEATPKDCSAAGDQCNDGVCNAGTGACEASPAVNGTSCDDGNLCTEADQCSAGFCEGSAKDCSGEGDDCNDAACNAATGACDLTARPDGTLCSDDNLCTLQDQCVAGACDGAPLDCSHLDQGCIVGVCNGDSGGCVITDAPADTPCDDGNGCTAGDVCLFGSCAGTDVPNGGDCSDEDPCTVNDQCVAGECGGSAKDCSAAGDQCNDGICNVVTGACEASFKPTGVSCSDGNPCTVADQCTDGVCAGGPTDCSGSIDQCNDASCNQVTGVCDVVPKTIGTPCDDADPCTENDQCGSGLCGGSPKNCSAFSDQCNTGTCNGVDGSCFATPTIDGGACDDTSFCTADDTCIGGLCIGGGNPCTGRPTCEAVCNEDLDLCAAAAGTVCADDGNVCTDDVCNGSGGCGVSNQATCDDGLFCTKDDACNEGVCGGAATCPQTPECMDTCNEDEDVCRRCGSPYSNTRCVVNAVFVLQGALGLRGCELCTCDVNASSTVTVSDALAILMTCANLPTTLICESAEPLPAPLPTTARPSTTSTTIPEVE